MAVGDGDGDVDVDGVLLLLLLVSCESGKGVTDGRTDGEDESWW